VLGEQGLDRVTDPHHDSSTSTVITGMVSTVRMAGCSLYIPTETTSTLRGWRPMTAIPRPGAASRGIAIAGSTGVFQIELGR
jgi:hypothetical protein